MIYVEQILNKLLILKLRGDEMKKLDKLVDYGRLTSKDEIKKLEKEEFEYFGKYSLLNMILDRLIGANKKDFIEYAKLFAEIYELENGDKNGKK